VTVGLLKEAEVDPFVQAVRGSARLSRLNPEKTPFIRAARSNLAQSFSFLANAAPVATANLRQPNMQPVDRDDVLHFDAVAELSQGAKRIGILKADVDRLGLLFREGLMAENGPLRPTLGRVMTLSSALDLFFAGWLNNVCAEVFHDWRARQQELAQDKRHPWYDKVEGLFYVMYSGGDDLFIVGPWDETLQLAERLQADFARYACHNPNVTLSAGFVQVKPRYPVQRFAGLVDEAEGRAKQAGRNRMTVFGQVVPWTGADVNFSELLAFSKKLQYLLETPDADERMPRTLLHDLGRLYRSHRRKGGGELKPMWTPRIFYTMARRLSRETLDDVGYDLMKAMSNHIFLVPVSYASLITRKE
jgi:CRISPR-associated protein Csm1